MVLTLTPLIAAAIAVANCAAVSVVEVMEIVTSPAGACTPFRSNMNVVTLACGLASDGLLLGSGFQYSLPSVMVK